MYKKGFIKLKQIIFSLMIFGAFIVPITAQKTNSKMLVSTNWLAKNLNKVVILHVGRNRENYDKGHIPNARFVGWKEITTTRNGVPNELPTVENLQKLFNSLGVGNTKRIIVYGDVQGLYAARAFFTLEYLGHGNRVSVLNGGLEKWKAENRKTSNENSERKSANFTPNIQIKKVTFLDLVKDVSWSISNLNNSNVALIDARPKAFYTGEKVSKANRRGGHIPGAKSVYWMQNIVSKENPVMRPQKELRKLYKEAGVHKNKTVIVYCQSGGQASHGYFTLKYLGYDVVMYDGSFFEWSRQADTKVTSLNK